MDAANEPSFHDQRYTVLGELGRGGMGIVYKCHDTRMKKDVAVKVVAWNYSNTDLVRFQREAKALASLQHPNILSVRDFGTSDDGYLYLVMDILTGKDLSSILDDRKIPIEEAVEIFIQICDGLSHAHNNGILHRDIKPSNIFVEHRKRDLIVTITDFGLAKLINEDSNLTQQGASIGSPPYMSPEQCNAKPATMRSDIYSLGCLMFEVLTGEPPFTGSGVPQTMIMHMNNKAPLLSDRTPGYRYPPELEQIVDTCLKKDPAERFQTMSELKKALLQLRDPTPSSMAESAITESAVNEVQADPNPFAGANPFSSSSLPAVESPPPRKPARAFSWGMVVIGIAALGCLVVIYFLGVQLMAPEPSTNKSTQSDVSPELTSEPTTLNIDVDPFANESAVAKETASANWIQINGAGANEKIGGVQDGAEYLDLSDSDTRDDALASLPETIKGLRLDRTSIGDKGARSVSELEDLEELSLKLCANVTDVGVLSLNKCKRLRRLILSGTRVTDAAITELKLPLLEDLYSSDCKQIKGENFSKLATNLPKLTVLNLARSGVAPPNLPEISAVNNLSLLDISELDLDNNSVKAFVSTYHGSKLVNLRIGGNRQLTNKSLWLISQIPTLLSLDVTGCTGLTGKGLRKFREVRPTCFPIKQTVDGPHVIEPGEEVD